MFTDSPRRRTARRRHRHKTDITKGGDSCFPKFDHCDLPETRPLKASANTSQFEKQHYSGRECNSDCYERCELKFSFRTQLLFRVTDHRRHTVLRASVTQSKRRCLCDRGALRDEARVGGTQVNPPGPLAAVRRSTCHRLPLAPSSPTSRSAAPVTSFYIIHNSNR